MKVMACKCSSEYQDKVYGPGVRVANQTAKGTKDRPDYRCTPCSGMSSDTRMIRAR